MLQPQPFGHRGCAHMAGSHVSLSTTPNPSKMITGQNSQKDTISCKTEPRSFVHICIYANMPSYMHICSPEPYHRPYPTNQPPSCFFMSLMLRYLGFLENEFVWSQFGVAAAAVASCGYKKRKSQTNK